MGRFIKLINNALIKIHNQTYTRIDFSWICLKNY